MKQNDKSAVMSLICGNWLSQVIYVSVKLKITDFLSEYEGINVDNLAKKTQTNSEVLKSLVEVLCQHGFCEKRDDLLYLTNQGKLLQSQSEDSLYAYIILNTEFYAKIWGNLLNSVVTGEPAYKTIVGPEFFSTFHEKFPKEAKYYDQAMEQKYKAHDALITKSYNKFTIFKSAIDIGGGQGRFLETILKNNPELKGIVYDLLPVITRPKISNKGKNLKIFYIAGDFFTSIPKGESPTLFILKAVLHDWDDTQALKILENCKKVMTEKDVLLIVEKALAENEKNTIQPLMNLHMFLLHNGKERKLTQLLDLIYKAGLNPQPPITSLDDGTKLVEVTRIRPKL